MAEQYKFPDELDDNKTQKVEIIQPEDDVEIEIVDDTPIQDRGRRPLGREVEDPTDEEIESYTVPKKPFLGKNKNLSVLHNTTSTKTTRLNSTSTMALNSMVLWPRPLRGQN